MKVYNLSMRKTVIRNYRTFESITSDEWGVIILKLNHINGQLDLVSELISEKLGVDFLKQSGVYFLQLKDGYYIGETKDLSTRFMDHIEKREVESITLATYKSHLDKFNKETIKDLESILIIEAESFGISIGGKLKNVKQENRKTLNILDSQENEELGKYIWDKFAYLNMRGIIEELQTKDFIVHDFIVHDTQDLKEAIIDAEANKKKFSKAVASENKVWEPLNVSEHKVNVNDDFFKYVPSRTVLTKAYNLQRGDVFMKQYIEECLFEYLYIGNRNALVDVKITNGRRDRGFVTAMTLAYFRIETNGSARGSLKNISKAHAQELIKGFVERNY